MLLVVHLGFKRCKVGRDVEHIFTAQTRGGGVAQESGVPIVREETPFDIS